MTLTKQRGKSLNRLRRGPGKTLKPSRFQLRQSPTLEDSRFSLKIPQIRKDFGNLVFRYFFHGRHVPEIPVVLANSSFYREKKSNIGVVIRMIETVQKRRAFPDFPGFRTMALPAVFLIERLLLRFYRDSKGALNKVVSIFR